MRNLVIVLGDQLDEHSSAFDGLDCCHDAIWMAEVPGEARFVWSHKARIALFFSAMRHFRKRLVEKGYRVIYRRIGEHTKTDLSELLMLDIGLEAPEKLIVVKPGEYRVQKTLENVASVTQTQLEIRRDRHFISDPDRFADWSQNRRELRTEHFYRKLRKETGVLMENRQPVGGKWNYDAANRRSFGKLGPPSPLPDPLAFSPNTLTQEAIRDVETHFAQHPGSLAQFDWPITQAQAYAALNDFIDNRLRHFGDYQDAMWSNRGYLYHSRISAALNLKLISPMEAIQAAESAYRQNSAPLESVEGFIRQILGWREFVRGVYWLYMPDYLQRNALNATQPLPSFYWTGDIEMNCLKETLKQTLALGYAHHIQRLMVTGLFGLLLGVTPQRIHEWYLAIYVDAVEWVELPNTLGMSQYADGGIIASKPYVASGSYVDRMSNYCRSCPYSPKQAIGPSACPFTTLYWDFLDRHRARFARHPRTALQWRNVERIDQTTMLAIKNQAVALRARFA